MEIDYSKADVAFLFEKNPLIDHLLVVEDGHVFLPNALNFCIEHCKRNGLKYEKVLRDGLGDVKSLGDVEVNLEDLKLKELIEICQKYDMRFTTTKKSEAIKFINDQRANNLKIVSEETDTNTEA